MKPETKKNIIIGLLVIIALGLLAGLFIVSRELDSYRNALTARDAQIQALDREIGIARSNILSVSELNEKYRQEIDAFPEKLKGIIKAYDLKLLSRDRTIASLKNKVRGGTTVVEVIKPGSCDPESQEQKVIAYQWEDSLKRFKLVDPDIFTQNNEEFLYTQHIAIKGHVLYGKDGRLQIRKVQAKEVHVTGEDTYGNPTFEDVEGGELQVVDSEFEYSDPNQQDKNLADIFRPRIIASLDTSINKTYPLTEIRPGIGIELLNLGRYIDHANLGLNVKINPILDDIQGGSLLGTRVGLGLNYNIAPPLLNTNFALGISASTPSNNLLNDWHITTDAIFYITN